MPTHKVQAPDGKIYTVEAPEWATEDQIFRFVQSQIQATQVATGQPDYSKMTTEELEAAPSASTSLGDIGRSFGAGLIGTAKSVTDVFGAGSDASNYLGQKVREVQSGMSPERQAEMARRQELEKRAAASGDWAKEAKAFLSGVAEAPLQSAAQGIGSSAAGIITGLASLAGGAPAGLALGVGTIARAAVGAAQGIGEYKGSIHDEVKKAYMEKGYSPQDAEQLAIKAQEYSMDKALEIGGSGLLGALDAFTGIESGVRGAVQKIGRGKLSKEAIEAGIKELPEKAVTAPSLGGAALRSIAGEAPLEGFQGGFGQYAQNLAMQREGLLEGDVTQGVLGAALRDAAVGALTGGTFTPVKLSEMRSDYNLDQLLRQQKEEIDFNRELQVALDAANRRAKEEGVEAPAYSGIYDLSDGYQLLEQELPPTEAPVEHHIMEEGGAQPLATVQTEEEVAPKIERLNEIRKQEAEKTLGEIEKINSGVAKQEQELELMEATGQARTPEYAAARQNLEQSRDEAAQKIKDLMDKNEFLTKPLVHIPGEAQPQIQKQYTLTKEGQPVGVYKSFDEVQQVIQQAKAPEVVAPEVAATEQAPVQPIFSPEQTQALKEKLEPMLAQFGLKDVGLQIADKLENGAGGKYLNKLISVALDEPQPVQVMRHESVHALKDLGFFTPQQWSVLQNMARKKWIDEHLAGQQTEIDGKRMSRLEGYRQMGLTEDEIIEEAIADAFGSFDVNKAPPGMLAAIHAKLKKFFEALKNGFTGAGFQSAESVFGKIERGELKATQEPSGEAKFSKKLTTVDDVINDGVERLLASAQKHRLNSLNERYDVGLAKADTALSKIEDGILKRLADVGVATERDAQGNKATEDILYNKVLPAVRAKLKKEERYSIKKAEPTSPLQQYVTPEEAAGRVGRRLKRAPGTGAPTNTRTVLGSGKNRMVVGRITHEDWLDRVKNLMSAQELKDSRYWYKNLHDTFEPIFGEKSAQYALAWLLSQQRASPTKGLTDVLRAADMAAGKQKVKIAGLNEQALIDVLQGKIPASGLGAKLLDFVDSELGKTTRTYMRGAKEGRQPAAIDVWAQRDIGFVDNTVYEFLKKEFGADAVKGITPDKSVSGETQYEYGIDFYNDVAEMLNKKKFMGGKWTAPEVQAVGWVTMQRAMGIQAEFVRDIIAGNTRRVSIGLAPGEGSPMAEITHGKEIPLKSAHKLINKFADMAGVKVLQNVTGVGAYLSYIEGSIQIDGLASPESVQDFMDMVGYAFQQTEVINTRRLASGKNMAIDVLSKGLEGKDAQIKFFTEFLNQSPKDKGGDPIAPGFQPIVVDGVPGIRLLNFGGNWRAKQVEQLESALNATAEATDTQLDELVVSQVQLSSIKNDWKEDKNGKSYLDSLRSRGRLQEAQFLQREFPPQSFELAGDNTVTWGGPKYSLRSEQLGIRPSTGGGVVLGESKQPGAVSYTGVHYGNAKVDTLNGNKYGTGIRGAERRRLEDAFDDRIKRRIYFYIAKDDGNMPLPESGLGGHVYTQQFDNILGPGPEMSKLFSRAQGDSNNFESEVIDAGYDGYAVPSMGMMVILNHDAPVNYAGPRSEFGGKASLKRIETPEFKRWFGDSKIVNEDGTPKVMYHGTYQSTEEGGITVPRTRGNRNAFFVTPDPNFASKYALNDLDWSPEKKGFGPTQEGAAIYPVYISAKNPFDYENPDHMMTIIPQFRKVLKEEEEFDRDYIEVLIDDLRDGKWSAVEWVNDYDLFEKNGFDAFYTKEQGRKNLGVFEPTQIKSATGNLGTYSTESPDIRRSLKRIETPEFKRWFGDSKVVDAEGKPLVVYHGTGFDFDVFEGARKGTEKAYFFAQSPELASDFALTSAGAYDGNANVMPVYLKMDNPLIVDYKGAVKWGNDRLMKQMLSQVWDGKYDGVIAKNVIDGSGEPTTIYAIITPNQVKSATGNNGQFDPNNPDIRRSLKRVSFPNAREAKAAVKEAGVPDTPGFKKFINHSFFTNEDGTPKVMYHGTSREFFEFTPAGDSHAIFISDSPEEAEGFASADEDRVRQMAYQALTKEEKAEFFQRVTDKAVKDKAISKAEAKSIMDSVEKKTPKYGDFFGGDVEQIALDELIALAPAKANIMPVYVSALNLFDFENPDHVASVIEWGKNNVQIKNENPEQWWNGAAGRIKQGVWQTIEDPYIQRAIRAGFDGFSIRENRGGKKNYAVYRPQQLKSATGNDGDFNGELKDVRYSLRSVRYTPERFDKLYMDSMYTQNDKEKDTKGYLGFVQPMDFVRATTPIGYMETLRSEQEPLDFGKMKSLGPIALQASVQPDGSWKITGHEGRHRMLALHDAGYRDIPVYISFASGVKDAKSFKTKSLPAQFEDAYVPSLLIAELEPLSYDNRDKAAETFMREKPVKYSLPQISTGAEDRVNATTTAREEKGWGERMMSVLKPENYSTYRQQFLNRYNELGVADTEVAKRMGGVKMMASQSAEHAALMSDMHAGVTASAFGIGGRSGGVPVIKNGLTTIDNSKKGLLEILQPLARYNDPKAYRYFQFYSAVKRGARLYSEGRERLIQPGDVVFANELAQKFPEFEQIRKDWVEYNNALIKYQRDAGVLSDRDAIEYTKHYDYIPFFRQLDGKPTIGPNIYQSISGVKKPKKLEGGEAPLADFLETVVRNSQAAIAAGMKNIAAERARDVGKAAGVVHDIQPGTKVSETEKIKVLEKGVMREYQSDDPLFVDAVKSLHMPDIPFMGILSGPSRLLREAVTRDPGFILANLMRDSLSAYATSGQNITPVLDTLSNFGKAYARKSPGFEALLNAGVIGGYEFSENVEQSGRSVAKELSKRAGVKSPVGLRTVTSLWDALEKGTTASDAATRIAVYNRVLQETGDEAEAIRAAWEIMNFNRKGSSPIIRVVTAAVPFLNARIQGLDVFWRAATGQMHTSDPKVIQRRFIARAAMMFALSFLYAAAVSGDPDYERQEDETKDNNWIIPGVRLKLPIPFEVGTLFKTIPERIYRVTFGTDTGKDFKEAMWRATMSTLPINPLGYVPQVVRPIIEATTNYNMFTNREIVGQGMKDVAPEYQVGPGTSHVSDFVGKTLGLSPMKVDHVIKGYTGTMGMYAIDLMDSIMDTFGASPKPNKRFEQMPVLKRFMADPEARGTVTAYYKLKDEVDTVVRTVNLLEKSMKPDEFAKYLQDNIGLLAFKDYVKDMEKSMKEFRDMKNVIRNSPMSGEEKKEALSAIGEAENNLTANIQQVKLAVSKVR